MANARADLIGLSDYVYERTRDRLDGLTDTEYLEPVPNCWTIRRVGSDNYQADDSDPPEIPPFTTIAWRLWHLVECYGGIRNAQWLGIERQPAGFERDDPAPATAAEAMTVLERAHAFGKACFMSCLQIPGGSRWAPLLARTPRTTKRRSYSISLTSRSITVRTRVLRDLYLHSRTLDRAAEPGH